MQYRTAMPCTSVTEVQAPASPGHEPSALHQVVHVPAGALPRHPVWGPHSIAVLLGLQDEPAASEPAIVHAYVLPSCDQHVWSVAQS
jgi:hypothetical protein